MISPLKITTALALAGMLMASSLLLPARSGASRTAAPSLVELHPVSFVHRAAGDFSRNGRPVNGPIETIKLDRPIAIMARQVNAAEYQRCVEDGACTSAQDDPSPDRAAVNVSWRDAVAYAEWLSRQTGVHFRLPTDEEWAYAAGSRFHDEGWPDVNSADPAQQWISRYNAEADIPTSKVLEPIGTFGVNEYGLADIAGNVWEWTNTCFRRVALDSGIARARSVNCGVRVVEGAHRTYVTDFVRDARAGGCAIGTPPANLGFRLVVDRSNRWEWLLSLAGWG